jgi:hypothetical protein
MAISSDPNSLSAEQIGNAKIIAQTGYGMGASNPDIIVAIMAALQESSLRNLPGGDRDSAGLFQERPSQGWGTYAQVTDPVYASTKFFQALFKVPNRGSLSPNDQAQAVERSGFPQAYGKWQPLATNLVNSGKLGGVTIDNGATETVINDPTGLLNAVTAIGSAIGDFGKSFQELPKVFDLLLKLQDPSTWVRVGAAGLGLAFLFIGVFLLGREVIA